MLTRTRNGSVRSAIAAAVLAVAAAVGCGEREETPTGAQGTLHYRLGIKAYNEGRYADAVEAFEKALLFNPDLTRAYLDIAAIADDYLHDRDKATAYYKKYIALSRSPEMIQRVRRWLETVESEASGARGKPVDFSTIGQEGARTVETLQQQNAQLRTALEQQRTIATNLERTLEELRQQRSAAAQPEAPAGANWVWTVVAALCVLGAGAVCYFVWSGRLRGRVRSLFGAALGRTSLTRRQILGRYAWVENEFHSGTVDIEQRNAKIVVVTQSRETDSYASGAGTLNGVVLTANLRNKHGETAPTTFTFSPDGRTFVARWNDALGRGQAVGIKEE